MEKYQEHTQVYKRMERQGKGRSYPELEGELIRTGKKIRREKKRWMEEVASELKTAGVSRCWIESGKRQLLFGLWMEDQEGVLFPVIYRIFPGERGSLRIQQRIPVSGGQRYRHTLQWFLKNTSEKRTLEKLPPFPEQKLAEQMETEKWNEEIVLEETIFPEGYHTTEITGWIRRENRKAQRELVKIHKLLQGEVPSELKKQIQGEYERILAEW